MKKPLFKLQLLPKIILRYRVIVFWLLVLVLFGYTLMRLQAISNPSPDASYLKKKRSEAEATKIKIDNDLRQQIEQLLETPVNVTPNNLGSNDPFNP